MITTRAEARRLTERRILEAARRLFGQQGYDRTTIRAIAAAANSDAGLVMRYFGSKERLFAQAATIPADGPIEPEPGRIAKQLTAMLGDKLADEPAAALAALRAMFSHPEAAQEVRSAMSAQQQQVAALLPGDNAVLRAALIGAITLGTVIGRHLVQLDGLATAAPEDITAAIEPLLAHLVEGPPSPVP